MRVLFLGDIVGRAARHAVIEHVPQLRTELSLDFIVVNCENAAGGFGVTPSICDELFACGIDVLTTGNHVWDKREIIPYIEANPRLLRPINMAEGTPGSGTVQVTNDAGKRLVVVNAITNLFMNDYDPVFPAVNGALVRYADGRASLVVGTHTHVPTADHQILAGGTAFQTDAGMCGDYDSVIGMDKQAATARFTGEAAPRLSVAVGEPTLCGLLVESNDEGHAVSVEPLRRGGRLSAATPA